MIRIYDEGTEETLKQNCEMAFIFNLNRVYRWMKAFGDVPTKEQIRRLDWWLNKEFGDDGLEVFLNYINYKMGLKKIDELNYEDTVKMLASMENSKMIEPAGWMEKDKEIEARKERRNNIILISIIVLLALAKPINYTIGKIIDNRKRKKGEEDMAEEGKLEKLRQHYRGKLGELRERLGALKHSYCVGGNPETLAPIYKVPGSEKEKVRKELEEIEKDYHGMLEEMDEINKRLRGNQNRWLVYQRTFSNSLKYAKEVLVGIKRV